jgi:hypothetical protein
MWGDLSLGQLGKAGAAGSRPTQVPSLKNITQVALSEHLSVIAVAVDREGHVWSWGSLGPTEFLPPRRVPGLDNVVYVDYDIVGFALKSDGTAWVFWPPVGNFDPPQQIFSGVKAPETMLVPAPAMPCQSIAMPARRKDPPSQQQTPSPVQLPQQDPPLPGKKDPQADKTAPPPQGPERRPFVIVGRYTCHDKGDRPAGDVTVTTRSAVSCADAHAQQEKVRQSKGGDFCAAANSEHRTSGSPTFTQMGPC